MSAKFLTAVALGALLLVSACGKKEAAETKDVSNEGTVKVEMGKMGKNSAAAAKRSAEFLQANAKEKDVKVSDTGLQIKTVVEGSGVAPKATDLVKVHYRGTLIDGTVFDSSYDRGEPITFPLNKVIAGWTEGLQLMKEGGKSMLYLPSEMAYGETGTPGGPIGPNEALIFEVELLKVIDPARNLEISNQFLVDNANKEGVTTEASGLQWEVIEKGKGEVSPKATDTVEVQYRGTLMDGTEFDSSYARGESATFKLNRVIKGWTEGLQLMNEGDKYRFCIPPNLAYGETGTPDGPIGPNEALIFEVELVDVK